MLKVLLKDIPAADIENDALYIQGENLYYVNIKNIKW